MKSGSWAAQAGVTDYYGPHRRATQRRPPRSGLLETPGRSSRRRAKRCHGWRPSNTGKLKVKQIHYDISTGGVVRGLMPTAEPAEGRRPRYGAVSHDRCPRLPFSDLRSHPKVAATTSSKCKFRAWDVLGDGAGASGVVAFWRATPPRPRTHVANLYRAQGSLSRDNRFLYMGDTKLDTPRETWWPAKAHGGRVSLCAGAFTQPLQERFRQVRGPACGPWTTVSHADAKRPPRKNATTTRDVRSRTAVRRQPSKERQRTREVPTAVSSHSFGPRPQRQSDPRVNAA